MEAHGHFPREARGGAATPAEHCPGGAGRGHGGDIPTAGPPRPPLAVHRGHSSLGAGRDPGRGMLPEDMAPQSCCPCARLPQAEVTIPAKVQVTSPADLTAVSASSPRLQPKDSVGLGGPVQQWGRHRCSSGGARLPRKQTERGMRLWCPG